MVTERDITTIVTENTESTKATSTNTKSTTKAAKVTIEAMVRGALTVERVLMTQTGDASTVRRSIKSTSTTNTGEETLAHLAQGQGRNHPVHSYSRSRLTQREWQQHYKASQKKTNHCK